MTSDLELVKKQQREIFYTLEHYTEKCIALEDRNADQLAALTTIQDICQSPNYRTIHTLFQMCDFLDNINNIIKQAIAQVEGDRP